MNPVSEREHFGGWIAAWLHRTSDEGGAAQEMVGLVSRYQLNDWRAQCATVGAVNVICVLDFSIFEH